MRVKVAITEDREILYVSAGIFSNTHDEFAERVAEKFCSGCVIKKDTWEEVIFYNIFENNDSQYHLESFTIEEVELL